MVGDQQATQGGDDQATTPLWSGDDEATQAATGDVCQEILSGDGDGL